METWRGNWIAGCWVLDALDSGKKFVAPKCERERALHGQPLILLRSMLPDGCQNRSEQSFDFREASCFFFYATAETGTAEDKGEYAHVLSVAV
ncbi:hypothetical protein COCOBI_01-7940 [Coccomyxa sp. Obi]|nr:hypothetical protein COCOBI_01-7940 [Coccomyxa sp. Obi]